MSARVMSRVISLVAVAVVVGSVVSVSSPIAPAPPRPAPVSEAANTVLAVQAAAQQGSRVEVADLRSSTRAVYANPGGTMTAELSVVPTRTKQGNSWAPIDTSVMSRSDGSVGPRAADGGLSLSGGGSQVPLARMDKDGKSVALYWPGVLPVPRVDGATVTYPDVLAGVDLVMYAEPNGYRQQLVVKTAEAARNPALATIALRTETKGLRLTVDDAGAVRAADDTGSPVFVAPPSQMWDSSGPVPARSAAVKVSARDGSLVLQPDAELLADPDAVFPIVIDPDMRTWDKSNWASIASGRANTAYWWRSAAPNGGAVAQVGQCYNADGECGSPSIGELWAYFQFDTGFVAGKHILGSEFQSVVVHSPNCVAQNHQVHMVPDGGQIWNGMTWNSRLQGGPLLSEVGSPGVHDACPGHKPIGFGLPGGSGIGTVTSYFMKASNGGDPIAWRKYDPAQTRMFVHFNTVPSTPDQLATDPPLPSPCRWCAGKSYIGDASITLKARLSDPDGDQVRPQWRVSADGVEIASWDGSPQVSGATHNAPINLNDKHNKTIGWWVHASDGWDSSGAAHGTPFVVDRIAPKRRPKVTGVLYQEDGRWHGGVDVPGTFQFAADPEPGEANDINHYLYGWAPDPTTKVDAQGVLGGGTSVTLTPPGDGPRTLYVQSVDRAGHKSPTREYRIYVRAGNGPLAQWSFEGNANDTAFLGDRHGTLNGTASYAPGAIGNALQLDRKPTSNMSAPNAVRTDASFSVSAWVKLDQLPTEPTVFTAVSQEGSYVSSFFLSYRTENGGLWEFKTPSADAAQRPADGIVQSRIPAQLNTWTHIAGVYDASVKQIRLYVNGVPSAPVAHNLGFHATGPVLVGRAKWDNQLVNFWSGGVDEVQMYDRAVSEAEIKSLVSRANVQVADWRFEDSSGTTARNSVEGGAMAVLQNGASFRNDGIVKASLQLDGIDDHASTSGPIVRTDQSFSVAAWAKLDRVDNGWYTVVSQDGNRICSFCLQYEGDKKRWVFVSQRSDEDSPTGVDGVVAPVEPVANVPVHLVGTYDASTSKMRLYVDGELVGENTRVGAWHATGPFAIGRAKVRGNPEQHFAGLIDEVRVYSRVISAEEVRGIVGADGVTAGTWKLDGNATDSSGRGLNGTPGGSPEWAAGQTSSPDPADLAVKLDGSASHVSAPNAVVTDKSFSVTTWVRLDRAGKNSTAVSQDGTHVGGFHLRALPNGRWSFTLPQVDRLDSPGDGADGSAAQIGVWTHLAGVYSKDRQRLELYVNGVLVGSIAHTTGFNATGRLQIGRGQWNDNHVDYFPGAIDDVNVYSRALFADEIRTMAGRDLSLVHNWQLDETSGGNAADSVGVRNGTLKDGASFGPGRVGNAVSLDGVNDSVSTAGVDLRTDQGFTVSSWVYLNNNSCDLVNVQRCVRDAVTVDGSRTSKFRLGHVVDSDQAPRGKWVFEMPESDTDQAPVTEAALSVEPGEVQKWVHLTGVYDAATKKIWLYVDGDRVDDGTLNTPWSASGGLQIGRGKVAGQAANFWPGGVDDVRLYTGVQDKDRVHNLFRSYPAPAAPATLPAADAGHWKFDEGSGTTAVDSSPNARNATLRGGAGWHGARSSWGLQVDGTAGYAETSGAVLATNESFSVAAWAYASSTGGVRTVLGQDGAQVSTFAVQYRPSDSRWIVRVPTEDIANPATVLMTSTESVVIGQWMHLAVSYDAPQQRLYLYVNGALSAVQVGVVLRGSTGPFSIGRSKWNGANAEFFGGFIDDVRAYARRLFDGEIRKIYDDVSLAVHGYWRFDGTAVDTSWRQNPSTLSGTPSYSQGVNDRALQFDGTSVAVKAQHVGVPMIGSFSVSAWAKLARTDRVQTVLGEDGNRMSGYVLQYRPEYNRWVFAASTQDADGGPLTVVTAAQPPTPNSWTHLAGVYDYPAHQLRLYVDGELAGVRDNVSLWAAWGGFTIGRGKVNGQPADFFSGAIDEVITDMGAASDAEIARRGTYPLPREGQLGRFVNGGGDHYTASTSAPAPPGYHFEATLGQLPPAGAANTRMLYACKFGADAFTSPDPNCENQPKIGEIGRVYIDKPTSPQTVPVYRCRTQTDHFESTDSTCGGAIVDGPLGYSVGYSPIPRYNNPKVRDHISTVHGTPPGYYREGTLGYVSLTSVPGGQELFSCRDGTDLFTSTDTSCEGKTKVASNGWIWAQPPDGLPSVPLYRCGYNGDSFDSRSANCENQVVDRQLGYVLTTLPEGAL